MKRKNLFLTFLLIATFLLGVGAVMGQTTVTIGSGTTSTDLLPTNVAKKYSYSQQIYDASNFPDGNGKISSISFNVTTNTATRNLDVYLVNTTKLSFSNGADWIPVLDSDIVYTGGVTFTKDTWSTITLPSDFLYTGNNLAVIVNDKTGSADAAPKFYQFSKNGYSIFASNDDVQYSPSSPGSGSKGYVLNQIKIGITYDYPMPSDIAVTDITTNAATISWTAPTPPTAGHTFTGYQYAIKSSGTYPSYTATNNPINLNELEAGTNYSVRIRAVYTDSNSVTHYSQYIETSFTTECEAMDVPTTTWGFEDSNNLPDCWKKTAYTDSYPVINTAEAYAHSGSKSLQFNNARNNTLIVLMPAINESLNGKTISFYARKNSEDAYTYNVIIGYYNSNNEFVEPADSRITITNSAYSNDDDKVGYYKHDITNFPDYIRKIAIKVYISYNYTSLYLDDVKIDYTNACTPVSSPTVGTVTYNSAQLSWTEGGSETNWKLQYKKTADADWTTIDVNSNSYTLTGLTENTTYMWKVAAWCDTNDDSSISTYVAGEDFTTPVQFPMPTGVTASSITSNSANITWTAGSNETAWQLYFFNQSYGTPEIAAPADYIDVSTTPAYSMTGLTRNTTYYVYVRANYGDGQYSSWTEAISFRTSVLLPYSYDFTDASELNAWTLSNCYPSTGIAGSGSNYYFHFIPYSSYNPQYLITPFFENNSNALLVSFDYKLTSGSQTQILNVGYSTTNKEIGSFTWLSDAIEVNSTSYKQFEYIFQVEGIKYIAVKFDRNGLYLNTDIDNISFTPIDKVFTGGSENWNNSSNWTPEGLPEATHDVYINHAMIIPNACTAEANNITLGPSGSLTIADGGQLICNNAVEATIQKNITQYTVEENQGENKTDGWYFIASPVNYNPAGTNLLSNTYDLFLYDEAQVMWRNYEQAGAYHHFSMEPAKGYLYANSEDTELSFAGLMPACTTNVAVDLSYSSGASMPGFNLVGNPFTNNLTGNVTIGGNPLSAYSYVEGGSEILSTTLADRAIKPAEGFLVQATDENQQLIFNPSSKGETATKSSFIRIEAGNADFMDRAYVQIGQGNTLRKMTINDNVSHVYVMSEGKDYAAATIQEAQGEMPLNFKAAKNGQYTITVNPENVEMDYLHLVDNLTGADIDLLSTPSYTFNAKTTDYASRFRLLFAANGIEENGTSTSSANFAFISNGQLIVNGTGTLQIIDMTGRVVSTKSTEERISTNELTPGVYVVKLIGNETKTQKIVIE